VAAVSILIEPGRDEQYHRELWSVCVCVCRGSAGEKKRLVRQRELLAVIRLEFVY